VLRSRRARKYSPAQIAARLRMQLPTDPEMWVSAETIYQSLYVTSRGALKRELTAYLRTGRTLRKPGRRTGQRRNRIPDMANIAQRPQEADDRDRAPVTPRAVVDPIRTYQPGSSVRPASDRSDLLRRGDLTSTAGRTPAQTTVYRGFSLSPIGRSCALTAWRGRGPSRPPARDVLGCAALKAQRSPRQD
jgi:hypothetical protein